MRRIHISFAHHAATLPKELEAFTLYPTDTAGIYDTPYTTLGSQEWANFEQVLTHLKNKGSCISWQILDVH